MRILFLLAALFLLGTFAPPGLQRNPPPPPVSWVDFAPVALRGTGTTRLGGLRFLGGWAVTSNDPRFGGISAMHVSGGETLAVSDAGWRMRIPLPGEGAGRARVAIDPVEDGPGPFGDKENRDVESMAVAGGEVWLGFERANAVWRYDLARFDVRASAAPAAMRGWTGNRGAEAMVRLPDGRFLVFAEGEGGDSEVLLFAGDPALPGTAALRLRYRPPAGYRVTDAAWLLDGRLVLLNRRVGLFDGFTAKLVVARLPPLAEGALIAGTETASFEGPVTRDNLEALSVTREGGRTILWIASDDNYNPLQRTLLMKFALVE